MAETLTEAIGQQVRIVAEINHEDWPGHEVLYAEVNGGHINRIYGSAPQLAELLREYRR
ncbi:hypothetical protein ACFVX9_14340 [Kitasatospora sp. NPDC058243]|uniref:hypothetical protein n=1 Tax=Kitasatospora sp. NPDC058243 TaxID=3346397 RepID=UPI0036DB0C30